MQQQKESNPTPADNNGADANQHMATNPNPRANENIKESPIDKNTATDNTDGEAS